MLITGKQDFTFSFHFLIKLVFCIFIVLILNFSSGLSAVNYYVDDTSDTGDVWTVGATGDDANAGTLASAPKRTLTNLLSFHVLAPGDIVYIDTGFYNEQVLVTSADAGDPTGEVWFRGAGTGNSVISGLDRCIKISNCGYVRISDMTLTNSVSQNLYFDFATNSVASNLRIIRSSQDGVFMYDSDRNRIMDSVVTANGSSGISQSTDCILNIIIGNYISSNVQNGIWSGNMNYSNRIRDNIICSNGLVGVMLSSGQTILSNNNIFQNGDEGVSSDGYNDQVVLDNRIYENGWVGNKAGLSFWWNGSTSDNNTVKGNLIHHNADVGFYNDGFNAVVSNNQFYSNDNHGVYLKNGNYVFSRNISYGNNGAGFWTEESGGSLLINSTFFGNMSDGVYTVNNSLVARNCIAESNGGYGFKYPAVTPPHTYCNSFGNTAGQYQQGPQTGDISLMTSFSSTEPSSPAFLYLNIWSPCINAGDLSDPVPPGGTSAVDMGAYEYTGTVNSNYYVNDGNTSGDIWCFAVGDDSNDGRTAYRPKRSLTNLLSSYSLSGGDVVLVDTGTYSDEPVTFTAVDSGSSEDYLYIIGAGTNLTFYGGSATAECFLLNNADWVRISGFRVTNYVNALKTDGASASNNLIVSNLFRRNTQDSIRLQNNSFGNIIRANTTCLNDYHGISLHTSPSNLIEQNNVYSNTASGNVNATYDSNILLEVSPNTVISRNRVWGCVFSFGINLENAGSDNCVFRSNIVYDNALHGFNLTAGAGDFGLYYRNAVFRNGDAGFNVEVSDSSFHHNTVVSNTGDGYFYTGGAARNYIHNNIFAFNGGTGMLKKTGATPAIYNNYNDVFGNGTEYGNPPAAGADDKSVNPFFSSFDPDSASFLSLQSISTCIDTGTNLGYSFEGTAPDMGWKEYVPAGGSPSISLSVDKTITNIDLNGTAEIKPGALITYKLEYSIVTNLMQASNVILHDKLPLNVTFFTDYAGTASGWTPEYSTNPVPDLSYNSSEFTPVRPADKTKILWVRWKKSNTGQDSDSTLFYKVLIR